MNTANFGGELNALWLAFLLWLPKVVEVILILIIGYIVSWVLKNLVRGGLKRAGLDRRLHDSPADNVVHRMTNEPSELVGKIVYWLGLIVTYTMAIFALRIPALSAIVQGVYRYIPNVIAAIIILAVALAVAAGIGTAISRLMGDTPTGKILTAVLPTLILVVSGFAILDQLKIAPTIVTITYIALTGSIALGFAIAAGLGGRDVAARLFEQGYETGRKNMDQVKHDIQKGKERGEREAKRKSQEM